MVKEEFQESFQMKEIFFSYGCLFAHWVHSSTHPSTNGGYRDGEIAWVMSPFALWLFQEPGFSSTLYGLFVGDEFILS